MDADKPLVSVLMSVYNEDTRFLRESIESILNQTYKDFEFIIVCDNPNNERVKCLLKEYSEQDHRIILHFNEQNIGLTKSLNLGMSLCSGEFVARMDADDVSMPNRLKKQIAYFDSHPDCDVVGTNAKIIDENGNLIRIIRMLNGEKTLRSLLFIDNPFIHPSVMFRRVINGMAIKYNQYYKYAQDYALWASLWERNFANINEELLFYRVNKCQITNTHREEQLEFAHDIQDYVIRAMGIKVRADERNILNDIADSAPVASCDVDAIKSFILHFNEDNKNSNYLSIVDVNERLLPYYRNAIFENCSYGTGFIQYYKLLKEIGELSIVNLRRYLLCFCRYKKLN